MEVFQILFMLKASVHVYRLHTAQHDLAKGCIIINRVFTYFYAIGVYYGGKCPDSVSYFLENSPNSVLISQENSPNSVPYFLKYCPNSVLFLEKNCPHFAQ